jgi:V/A-type H+-transporting ATPase subunit E
MNGGEKILNRIKADGDKVAEEILLKADKKCGELLSEAEIQAEKSSKNIIEKAKEKVKQIDKSSKSRCELEIRNTILRQRRVEIDKTMSDLQDYLLNLNDAEYFDFLYKLAKTLNVTNGEVYLNKKDLARIPANFKDNFKNSGIDVTVSDNTVNIPGGFILKNGNIEENMAIDAVIMSNRDKLEDIISRELFK